MKRNHKQSNKLVRQLPWRLEKKERESPNESTFASEESSEEETETTKLKGKQSLGGPTKNDDSESPSSPEPAMPGKHVEKTVEKAVSFGSNNPASLASASVASSSGSTGEGTQAFATVSSMSPLKPSRLRGLSIFCRFLEREWSPNLTSTCRAEGHLQRRPN